MTMHDRLRALRTRCEQLTSLQERVRETTALDARLNALQQACEGLPDASSTASLLRSSGIPVSITMTELTRSRERIQRLITKFSDKAKASTLSQSRDWQLLLKDLEKIAAAALSASQDAWDGYARRLFPGDPPQVIEDRMPKTPENLRALAALKQKYSDFRASIANIPTDKADIEAARSAALRLVEALNAFKFDVSEAVALFFAALPRGGAPLALFTEEVRQYLEKNGQLNQYKVVSRNQ